MGNYNFRNYDIEELVSFEIAADAYATMIFLGYTEFQASQKYLDFESFDAAIYYDYIRRRDNYICQKCGKPQSEELIDIGKKLSIHHIDNDHSNDVPENLITYCNSCHQSIGRKIDRENRDKEYLEMLCSI